MRKFLPILLVFFACKKNGETTTPSIIIDSAILNIAPGIGYYKLDVNQDKIADIKLGWGETPSALNVKFDYAVALHSQVKIHVTQQTVPICRDTTGSLPCRFINTFSCQGTGTPMRIDSFIAPPNLDSVAIYNTSINTVPGKDSFLLLKKTWLWSDPFCPYWYGEDITFGFFAQPGSGYFLFSVNSKRYALQLNHSHSKHLIGNLIRIDP